MQILSWRHAARHILDGGLLAYPTDTVWGLGCRADDPEIVSHCLALKGEKRQSIASVIPVPEQLEKLVHLDPASNWQAFFPGPYTLILPLKDKKFMHLAGPGPSLGCRLPDFPEVLELVRRVGVPLVTTSLNEHGTQPAKNFDQARALAQRWQIPLIRHEKQCALASTVLKWTGQNWTCLRQGSGLFPID